MSDKGRHERTWLVCDSSNNVIDTCTREEAERRYGPLFAVEGRLYPKAKATSPTKGNGASDGAYSVEPAASGIWLPGWAPRPWRGAVADVYSRRRPDGRMLWALMVFSWPDRWVGGPIVRCNMDTLAYYLQESETGLSNRMERLRRRGHLERTDDPARIKVDPGGAYAAKDAERFLAKVGKGGRQYPPDGAWAALGIQPPDARPRKGRPVRPARIPQLNGMVPKEWAEGAASLTGRKRATLDALVREGTARVADGRIVIGIAEGTLLGMTGLDERMLAATLRTMRSSGVLGDQDPPKGAQPGRMWVCPFPDVALSPESLEVVSELLDGGKPGNRLASVASLWRPRGDAPSTGQAAKPTAAKATEAPQDRSRFQAPKEQPLMARLRKWASNGVHETLAERRCADAVRKGTVGVLVFDPDAEEAATAYKGRIEHIPFPETVVALSDKEGDVLVCLAEDTDGRVFAGCCGAPDPEARQAALRAAAFTADMGGLTSQEVNQGERLIVASGTWETLSPSVVPPSTSAAVRVGAPKAGAGAYRGSLGHPRRRPQEHQVRGHWRMQRVGEGRQEVKRVWVSAHRRGGGVGLADGGHRGRGKVYRVRLG